MPPSYQLREATVAEAPLINSFRQAMFVDMGDEPGPNLDAVGERYLPWLTKRMESGEFRAWVIEYSGEAIACTGLWFKDSQPGPRNLVGRVGYIINVYTRPEHRRRGLARMLVDAAVAASRAEGLTVAELHASDEGRPLYESMGFRATNEMRLPL